jgi:hypothetical protein
MAKERSVTLRIRTQIRRDLGSVFQWVADPARRLEQRATCEQYRNITDFSWSESSDEYTFTSVGEWTSATGVRVHLRIASERHGDPDELSRRIVDGYVVHRAQVYQRRLHRNGREDTTEIHRLTEYQAPRPGRTILYNTMTVRRVGRPWWQYYLCRFADRQNLTQQLRLVASRCETDVATTVPPGPSTESQ